MLASHVRIKQIAVAVRNARMGIAYFHAIPSAVQLVTIRTVPQNAFLMKMTVVLSNVAFNTYSIYQVTSQSRLKKK